MAVQCRIIAALSIVGGRRNKAKSTHIVSYGLYNDLMIIAVSAIFGGGHTRVLLANHLAGVACTP